MQFHLILTLLVDIPPPAKQRLENDADRGEEWYHLEKRKQYRLPCYFHQPMGDCMQRRYNVLTEISFSGLANV